MFAQIFAVALFQASLGDLEQKSAEQNFVTDWTHQHCFHVSDGKMVSSVYFQKPTATSPPGNIHTNLVTAAPTSVTATSTTSNDTDATNNDGAATTTTMPAFTSTPKPQVNSIER